MTHYDISHGRTKALMQATTKTGLYRPEFEHDACGVGFVADIGG